MMFIVRSGSEPPDHPDTEVKLNRATPATIPDAAGQTDFFCVGDAEAIAGLRSAGWKVVELRDGYYEDGRGGGVAIWGQGKYWEIRDTPFTVREAAGPSAAAQDGGRSGERIDVRRAIFGA